MSASSAFSIRSREVADRFLHSAVIVDDQARLGPEPRVGPLVAPGRRQGTQTRKGPGPLRGGPGAATHDLDAKRLVDAFAELGVVCAVLKPDLGSAGAVGAEHADTIESLSARVDEATKRADIVILDWNISGEASPGERAKQLIREILRADRPTPRSDDHSRRLRLIAIYTGDEELGLITDAMADLLDHLQLGRVSRNPYRVRAGPVSIAVYGKGKPAVVGSDAERRISEDELPQRLRDDFSAMTEGLLSNTALAALSSIRTNTHRILSRFGPGVDAPYVAHRAMMHPPEEAEEHPVPLIASEIEGLLAEDRRISELVGIGAISEWLDEVALNADMVQGELELTPAEFRASLRDLLERGIERAAEGSVHPNWWRLLGRLKSYDRNAASDITQALAPAGEEPSALDMEFARLTSLRSQYDAPPPVLKLGSIVSFQESGALLYLLCIQPLCDSVRLDRPRKFPFLKLKERDGSNDDPFDLVIVERESRVHKRFYVSRKAYDIRTLEMKPDASIKAVRAEWSASAEQWHFPRKGGSPVRWIADLKPDFAHRLVNEFVGDVARVGLTESEWLRRMGKVGTSGRSDTENSPVAKAPETP